MKSPTVRHCWTWLLLTFGLALIIGGLSLGYYWFYKFAPTIHLASSIWRSNHSSLGRWEEEKKDYRRLGSSPDMFFRGDKIGYYGNKEWARWLVDNVVNTKGFRVCGCTHSALELMTNQPRADSWEEWLGKHQDETQEQWLQQGFRRYGVTVRMPPAAEDHGPLLTLLGNREANDDDEYIIPGAVRYNAFRWLRDSGFDWEKYVKERKDWQASEQLTEGLCAYIRFEARFPASDGLGILAFGAKPDPLSALEYDRMIPVLSWWFKTAVYAIILTCLVLGAAIVALSRRKMKVQ